MTNGLYSSDLRGLCLKKLSTLQNLPYWFGKMRYTKIVFFQFQATLNPRFQIQSCWKWNMKKIILVSILFQNCGKFWKKVFWLKVISSSINLLFLRSARFVRTLFIDFVMIEKLITPVNKASFVSKNADGFFWVNLFFFLL